MPSVYSRPLIESDGNNYALRSGLRFLKKLILRAKELLEEGAVLTEDFLDLLGTATVRLIGILGFPISALFPKPKMFDVFIDKTLPQSLPLIFVLHIILLVYSTYVLCYMPAVGLSFDSAESISFHIITGLAIISYYRGVVTDPGHIPPTSEWEKDNISKKAEGLRFCNREKKFKPERAHYCSAIGRNVLKMDHYCPWLANCVGYFNYKFFLLFIIYASVACGWTTVSTAHLLAKSSAGLLSPTSTLSAAQTFFLTEGLCISSLVSLILTPFTGFHLWLLANNKTTLEYCEKANSKTSYDFGFFHNLSNTLGWNPVLWFFPIQSVPSDGLSFDRRPHVETTPTPSESDDDEAEIRIRNEMEKKFITNPPAYEGNGRGCCIRRWDTQDSPLVHLSESTSSISGYFFSCCSEINSFREKITSNFTKIIYKSDSGNVTPKSDGTRTPVQQQHPSTYSSV
jgi:palmitoyltransferase ZDHHC2/15/20